MFVKYCGPLRLFEFYDNLGEIDTFILLILFHSVGIFHYFFQNGSVALFIQILCLSCGHGL